MSWTERQMRSPASWVIRERSGRVLFETFNVSVVERLNRERYEAVPILEYLFSLNRRCL